MEINFRSEDEKRYVLQQCPYCDHVEHISIISFSEDLRIETACRKCNKAFISDLDIIPTILTKKADCLNGLPHKYSERHYHSINYGKRIDIIKVQCEYCDIIKPGSNNGY